MGDLEQTKPDALLQPWIAALDEFERRFERSMRGYRYLQISILIAATGFGLYELLSTNMKQLPFLGIGALLGLIALLLSGKKGDDLQPYQQPQLTQMRHGDLAERIASGQISGNEVAPYAPAVLRGFVPDIAAGDRVRLLRRVCSWAEWYLGPPRAASNVYLSMSAGFAGLPVMLILMGLLPDNGGYWWFGILGGLLFSSFVVGRYVSDTQVFMRYLREEWTAPAASASDGETALAGPASSMPARAAATMSDLERSRTRQVQLVLNQAEQDLNSAVHGLVILPIMGGMLCGAPLGEHFYPAFIPAVFLPMLIKSKSLPGRAAYAEKIRQKLESSALPQRLMDGEFTLERIREYVPRIFWSALDLPGPPKGYADALRIQLWRLHFNLDWYLEQPRQLIRPVWIATILQLLLGLGIVVVAGLNGEWFTLGPEILPLRIAAVAVLLGLLVPSCIYAVQVSVWNEELLAYLRRCFSAEESS